MRYSQLLRHAIGAVLSAILFCGTPSSASAYQFMIDLEANGKLPGQSGGKSAPVSLNGQSVPIDIFVLIQGNDANAMNDSLKAFQAIFFSTNDSGSILGDLSTASIRSTGPPPVSGANTGFNTITNFGTPIDADGDGDLDIGKNGQMTGHFLAAVNLSTDYGWGLSQGFNDGIVDKNSLSYAPTYSAASFTNNLTGFAAFARLATLNFVVNDGSLSTGKFTDIQGQPLSDVANTTILHFAAVQGASENGSNANTVGMVTRVLLGQAVRVTMVPEPSTIALAGLGFFWLAAVALCRRRA